MVWETTFNILASVLIFSMKGNSYRELIKKASAQRKFGRIRAFAFAVMAIILVIAGLLKQQFEYSAMGILVGIIAWNSYSMYVMSVELFSTIEELTQQFSSMNDMPE